MDSCDLELIDRYQSLTKNYLEMCPKLAKHLEDFGRLRNELQILSVELKKRNIDVKKIYETIDTTT